MKSVTLMVAVLLSLALDIGATQLTLEQAITLSKEQSPIARIASQQVIEASARQAQARSAFLPMVRVSSGYTASDNAVNSFMFALNQGQFALAGDLNNPPSADNFQASAQVGLSLFNGGRDLANLQAAGAARAGTEFLRKATGNEITLGVTRMYLAVLTAQEAERACNSAVEAFASAEKVMTSRVENGTALKTDLLNIQLEKARSEEQLLRASNGLALAKEGLRLAIGLDSLPYTEFESLDQIPQPAFSDSSNGLRPEIQARDLFARAAGKEYRAAWGGYMPSISAFASADYARGFKFKHANNSWTAGVMLNWNIFDGLFTNSSIREKRARMKSADESARMTRLQTSVELTSARNGYSEASQRVVVMQHAVELATESVRLTRTRFDQGLVLTSNVIDAENNLVQATVGLAQAKADKLFALAQLRRALSLPLLGEK
jgi:outer membrane protein